MSSIGIKITGINLVCFHDINSKNTECLCTRSLMGPTANEVETKKIDGLIVTGICKHAFHKPCIVDCTKDNGGLCPMCKTPWKVGSMSKSSISIPIKTNTYSLEPPRE